MRHSTAMIALIVAVVAVVLLSSRSSDAAEAEWDPLKKARDEAKAKFGKDADVGQDSSGVYLKIGGKIVERAKAGSAAGFWGAVAGGAEGAFEGVTENAAELQKDKYGRQVVAVVNPFLSGDAETIALEMFAPWRHWFDDD